MNAIREGDDVDNDETFSEMENEVVAPPAPDPTDFAQQAKYWEDRAKRAEKQAVERKVALGRFETAAKHGVTPDAIPDWVPLDKMDEFAERFAKAASPVPTQTEPTEADTAETATSEAEAHLAAVAKGPASSGTTTQFSTEEALQLARTDPARFQQLWQAGSIQLPRLNIGRDRQQSDWEP